VNSKQFAEKYEKFW